MPSYSLNFRFTLPDYDISGWSDQVNNNFISIDSLLAQFTTSLSLQGTWTNGNMYTAGVSVIDALTGHIWYNAITHTSSAAPTTFATDRANNPSYWTDITNPAIPAAASATAAASAASSATISATAAAASAQQAAIISPFRNRICNAAMEIAQRGTTINVPLNTILYTLDRWRVSCSPNNITVSQGVLPTYASRKQLNITASITAGAFITIEQRIESADCADLVGKQVTVSFNAGYAYSIPVILRVFLASPTVTDNYTSSSTIQFIDVPLTATGATQYSVTFNAMPASVVNGLSLQFVLNNLSVTGGLLFNITNVVVEAGSVATSFEHVPVAYELQRCQRCYQRIGFNFSTYGGAGAVGTSTMTMLTAMRTATPTINLLAPGQSNCSGLAISSVVNNLTFTATATTTGSFQYSGVAEVIADL